MKSTILPLMLFVMLTSVTDGFAAQTVLWEVLKPGPFEVGFKSVQIMDESSKDHPLQVSLWYPAQISATFPSMRYIDYFLVSTSGQGKEPGETEQTQAVDKYKTRLTSFGVPEMAIEAWFETRMAGIRNAQELNQKFPLILIAQGNFHSAHDQAVLSEYMATYGYVIATCPSPTRIKPMETEEDVIPTAMQQASDLKRIVSHLKEEATVDASRIGIIGHSFGARSALLLAFQMPEVKAIVSLDGGIGSRQAKGLIERSPLYHPEEFRTPILHIYEDQEEFMQPDFDLLNSLKNSERYLMRVQNIHHHEFSSYGLFSALIPGLSSSPDLKKKWDVIYTYTLKFVNAFLKDDRLAVKFMKKPPDENGFSTPDFTFRAFSRF